MQTIRNMSLKNFVLFSLLILLAAVPAVVADRIPSERQRVLTTAQQRLQVKITYSCRGLSIDTVLMQLAEQAQIDIIKSPKVTGDVTVKITNVPLEEALSQILAAHGYTYIASENMIRVEPAFEVAEIREKLVTRIYRITYTDVHQVSTALQKFISKKGEIAINKGTSNLIVTDTESKIRAIDSFIEEIDRVTPQVLVEVKIYDITSKDRLDLGIEWSAGRTTAWDESTSGAPFLSSDVDSVFDYNSGAHEPFGRGRFQSLTSFTDDSIAQLEFGILNPHLNINAVLKMQKEDISATLLANPRVLVLDNETASFEIVSEIPYEERSENAGAGTITTIKFKPVGVKLEVTPHITRNDMLRLHIKPEFGVVVGLVGGSGAPVVDTRKVDTIALVKDGETVVIGGLRKKEINTQVNKVPFLGDLPLIGGAFKSEGEEIINSEIVVFITPKIITEPELSEAEKGRLDITEFASPEPTKTKAERDEEAKESKD